MSRQSEAAGLALLARVGSRLAQNPDLAGYDPIAVVTIADATITALIEDIDESELTALCRRRPT